MKKVIFNLFVLSSFIGYGQSQNNHWFFGSNAGIDFSSGIAVADTNGQLQSYETGSSISDTSGTLLFYTNGSSFNLYGLPGGVWNTNHQLMPNGVLNESTSCNSAATGTLIVPDPKNQNEYYIFTLDCVENGQNGGLRYHKVDMSLESGLGDVTDKEVPVLIVPLQESIIAIKHPNDSAYWLIVTELAPSNFHVLYLDAFGIIDSLVIPISSTSGVTGTMRINSTSDLFVNASLSDFVLYDFDNLTGQISNPIDLGFGGICAISPNDSVLYSVEPAVGICQFDLSAVNIPATKIIISPWSSGIGIMAAAPDGKIYIARSGNTYLDVIDNPNSLGMSCNYISGGFDLAGKTSQYGLPNFVYGHISNWCDSYDTINLEVCNTYESPSGNYTWTTSGQYADTVPTISGCDSILTINLTVLPITTSLITQDGLTLQATVNSAQYQWLNCADFLLPIPGETNQYFNVTANGSYAVVTSVNGCSDTSDCITVGAVGLENIVGHSSVFINPNPISNTATLFLDTPYHSLSLNILDCTGRIVGKFVSANSSAVNFRIDGDSGMYFLEVILNDKVYHHLKVLKL